MTRKNKLIYFAISLLIVFTTCYFTSLQNDIKEGILRALILIIILILTYMIIDMMEYKRYFKIFGEYVILVHSLQEQFEELEAHPNLANIDEFTRTGYAAISRGKYLINNYEIHKKEIEESKILSVKDINKNMEEAMELVSKQLKR